MSPPLTGSPNGTAGCEPGSNGGRDVLVETEQVRRVVQRLDPDEAIQGRGRVGLTERRTSLLTDEVHVRPGVGLTQCRREVLDPDVACDLVLRNLVQRSDVHHDAAGPMRER